MRNRRGNDWHGDGAKTPKCHFKMARLLPPLSLPLLSFLGTAE